MEGERLSLRNILNGLLASILITVMLNGCNTADGRQNVHENNQEADQLYVVTSFTLLTDMVTEIGGEHVEVYNLVPSGTDPHEYSPLPNDIKAVSKADILLYNGFNLEGGDNGWFAKMMESTNQDWDKTFLVTDGIEPLYIQSDDGKQEEINPHSFLDPVNGIVMAENIRDALIEVDPDNEASYTANANEYIAELEKMDEQYKAKINEIDEDNRILITSERAYQYVAKRYGLKEGFIWMIDTEENGTPDQITSLINFIKEHDPPVLFVETNVDPRPMETISQETGVEIYGELFSDEIGKPGEQGDTYIKYLQYNIDMIHEGLTSKQ